MHRLLERLDSAASTIVPLAYLAGLMAGTAAYFTGVTLDMGLAVGVALAVAAECHAFLEQRRVRALFASYSRAQDEDVREHTSRQLKAHIAILSALVAFSTYNSVAFVAATFRPIPGFLPGWLQVGIRGSVVPALFLLTGALSPLSISASDELAAASRHMLRRTIKATVKQWNGRIDQARRSGVDLAPVAVALMQDAGDVESARRVQLIAEGLRAAEMPDTPQVIQDTGTPVQADEAPSDPPPPPPDGPGSPVQTPRRSKRADAGIKRPRVLRLPAAEKRIREAFEADPAISIRALAKQAHVSTATASKYMRVLKAERQRMAQ